MKKISFKIPTAKGVAVAEGYRVGLMVGGKREWFVLQMDLSKPSLLTHYATGYRVANLRPFALARYVATGHLESETLAYWRKLGQRQLDQLDPARVRAAIAKVPVLNGPSPLGLGLL